MRVKEQIEGRFRRGYLDIHTHYLIHYYASLSVLFSSFVFHHFQFTSHLSLPLFVFPHQTYHLLFFFSPKTCFIYTTFIFFLYQYLFCPLFSSLLFFPSFCLLCLSGPSQCGEGPDVVRPATDQKALLADIHPHAGSSEVLLHAR